MKRITDRYEHQHEFNAMPLAKTDKILLAWDMGTGKSCSGIDWACARNGSTLVICPISVVHKWDIEVAQFATPEMRDQFTIMTKENFRKSATTVPHYDNVIVDEAHYFSGFMPTSTMSKSLLYYLKKNNTRNVLLLTATPYMSRPWNVYRLAQMLGHAWNFRDFEYEFFTHARMGMRMIPMLRSNMEARLAVYVHRIGLTKRLDECVDVPTTTHVVEKFNMTVEQSEAIKKLAYDANPIVRFGREHQICGGALKGDGFRQDLIIPSHKRQRVVELAEENDHLVVVCHHILEIETLKQALNNSGIPHVYVITGNTKDREAVIGDARNKEKAVLLVSSACSEGWEFPTARVMVFYSNDFSLKNYIQMTGRIQRINNLAKRTYVTLLVDGSIDEDVHKSLSQKKNFHLHIYAKQREV